jgi:hypothetical protein
VGPAAAAGAAAGALEGHLVDVSPAAKEECVQAEQLHAVGNGPGGAGTAAPEEIAGGAGVALV